MRPTRLPARQKLPKMNEPHIASAPAEPDNSWRGYTLADLRYRRAVNEVRIAMEQERLLNRFDRIINPKAHPVQKGEPGVVSRILRGISLVDYAMIAFSGGKQLMKIYRFFSRK